MILPSVDISSSLAFIEYSQVAGGCDASSRVDDSAQNCTLAARGRRKLESIGDENCKTHITDYYSIVDSIVLQDLLQQSQGDIKEPPAANCALTPVLISNADRNTQCLPKGRRHPEVLKKFAQVGPIFFIACASEIFWGSNNIQHGIKILPVFMVYIRLP